MISFFPGEGKRRKYSFLGWGGQKVYHALLTVMGYEKAVAFRIPANISSAVFANSAYTDSDGPSISFANSSKAGERLAMVGLIQILLQLCLFTVQNNLVRRN